MASSSNHTYWRIYFLLALVESAGFLFILLRVPSEGLSLSRLILLGILALALIAASLALFNTQRVIALMRPGFFSKLIPVSALSALALTIGLFLLRYLNPERLLVYYDRAAPVLYFFLFLSIQSLALFSLLHYGFHREIIKQHKSIAKPFLLFFSIFIATFILVAITKLGVTPDPAYWGEPGVPIFFWQLFIIFLIGSLLILFPQLGFDNKRFIIPAVIYSFALILWLSVPIDVLKTGFYVSMDAPTFQPFPYSDAGYYDWMGHSVLIGHPYQGDIPTRPLYIVFLALLHSLFGENYTLIIMGQTLLLAFIPVIFYYIGKYIHSQIAGLTVAFFFIFRELNSILITSQTRVSNSKTLLVDLPTLLLVSLSCLLVLRWAMALKKPPGSASSSALWAGGAFGLLLLLRTQSMLLLPFIFLLIFLVILSTNQTEAFIIKARESITKLIPPLFFFLLAFIFTVTPWLSHNYLQTGKFTFDAPFQYKIIAAIYTTNDLSNQETIDLKGKGVGSIFLETMIKDPGFVFGFITNHFLAGEIDGLLTLPNFKPFNGLLEPVNIYWTSWNGNIEWYNALLLLIYLAVISFGLSVAWKKMQWVGLTPLFFNIGYMLATSIGRFSGWRYDLPADWVVYFYFCIGLVELIVILISGFKVVVTKETTTTQEFSNISPKEALWARILPVCLFIFLGTLPWLAKGIAPERYPDQTREHLIAKLTEAPTNLEMADIKNIANDPNGFIQIGRVLYPRFYIRNDGAASARPWPAYLTRPYPRFGFLLLNQTINHVVFSARASNATISHSADVIILGCKHEDYVEARIVYIPQTKDIFTVENFNAPCIP
jgi:hypothetical protein